MNWDQITSVTGPWAYRAICSERDIEHFIATKRACCGNKCLIRVMRGVRCQTKRELLHEWAAALQFPYYFGDNWDAFEECIGDLEWISSKCYVFVITNADTVLAGESEELSNFMGILSSAASDWASRNVAMITIFHCQPGHEGSLNTLLGRAGVATQLLICTT